MADVVDLFTFRQQFGTTPSFGPFSSTTTPLDFINTIPVPGDANTGGVVGSVIDLIGGLIGGRLPSLPVLPPAPGGTPPLLPGRIPPAQLAPGAGGCLPNPCCSGQHLNKTKTCRGEPAGTKCVSNRRMNALNPKALRRAIRRAKGFERFVKSNRKSLKSLARI